MSLYIDYGTDVDIKESKRVLKHLNRDDDELHSGGFWDLSIDIVNKLQYMSESEKIEFLYNVLHEVKE